MLLEELDAIDAGLTEIDEPIKASATESNHRLFCVLPFAHSWTRFALSLSVTTERKIPVLLKRIDGAKNVSLRCNVIFNGWNQKK